MQQNSITPNNLSFNKIHCRTITGINALKIICGGSQMHPDINGRDAIFIISDRIKQTQNEWKVSELSVKIMVKGLYKFFKAVVN